MAETGTMRVKSGLAEMPEGGVIMAVTDAEQARIAEDAGAVAVMALERVPADIRREGGVARMADPDKIREIQEAVTIPVMAKARIGHFVEAQILEALEVDYIDESEVLTPADTALCMELGADGVFVGSGIFKSSDPSTRAKAIVEATTHYTDAEILARVSQGLGDAMAGLSAADLRPEELLETRGW